MRKFIIIAILVLIFVVSVCFIFEFGGGAVRLSNEYIRPGYNGAAIAFGLIASSALLGFVYYECKNQKSIRSVNRDEI